MCIDIFGQTLVVVLGYILAMFLITAYIFYVKKSSVDLKQKRLDYDFDLKRFND